MTPRSIPAGPAARRRRLPIIGVVGSGDDPHGAASEEIGRLAARLGAHLLTGGGGGVMAAVSRAFAQTPGRRGLTIGILPAREDDPLRRPKEGYPNRWVEIPIATHLPRSGSEGCDPESRNHINVLTPTAIVALPGGGGTESEVRLALRYRRPVIAYPGDAPFFARFSGAIPLAKDLDTVARFLARHLGAGG